MSDYKMSKLLIAKVDALRRKMKLPNTSESFIKAYQQYKINSQKQQSKPHYLFQFLQD